MAPPAPKATQPRLKLVCRRLPPGLTRAEFEAVLGAPWMPGAGCVAALSYRAGKVSTDAAKPSRPARAYLVLASHDHVKALAEVVRAASWHDAAKSWQDAALVGPPTLEYAPYPKTAAARRRHDNRQGTIDQDAEFKLFLESLTTPITKPTAPDPHHGPRDRITTTPLIEALREKKASRDKPPPKPADKDRTTPARLGKENTPHASAAPADKHRRQAKADKTDKADKADKALKEAIKIADAHAAASRASAPPPSERKRGNAATANSLVQRHLGVGPAPNRRRGTKREVGPAASDTATTRPKDARASDDKAKVPHAALPTASAAVIADKTTQVQKKERPTRAERRAFKAGTTERPTERPPHKPGPVDAKPHTSAKPPAPQILKKPQPPTAPKPSPAPRGPPTEPAAARTSPAPAKSAINAPRTDASSTLPLPATVPRPAPPSPAPAPMSKQAFLKHANPSQGITETLIGDAMKALGAIDRVEIDKRKGFAYVDFAEPAGLQKAMAASPIKIAQGAVQVLERKDKIARAPRFIPPPTGPARGGHASRGGFAPRGRGRGGARGGAAHVGAGPGTNTTADAVAPPTNTPAAT